VCSAANAGCDHNFICIKEEKRADQIVLHAENLSPYPVTYTLRVRTEKMTINGPETVTRTLTALESHRIMTLRNSRTDVKGKYRYNYDWTVGDQHAVHDDEYQYRLPYESGKSYRVIQGYGSRFSHTGLEQFATDFRMQEGTPVHAARGGIVARTEETNTVGCWRDGCGAHANYVVILHADGTTGEYYHLQQYGALVDVGEQVVAGQKIALSGNTGHTTIPHLHFAVYRAVEWGDTQSIAVQFTTADGVIDRTRRGGRYQATPIRQANSDSSADYYPGVSTR
jgi:murein DD-endopeptidase MepM/ murein hydrolase activator NlpD